jgi:WhiB family redox-sensing transcriptional regulator
MRWRTSTLDDNEDLDWQEYGNCVGLNPEIFFPERGDTTVQAKEVCHGCVVRDECLEYAVVHEKFGIWGGMNERERRRFRRLRAKGML